MSDSVSYSDIASESDKVTTPYPRCQLLDTNVVNELPTVCVFREPSPLKALATMQDSAWAMISSQADATHARGKMLLQQYSTCYLCYTAMLNHQWIRYLRSLLPAPRAVPRVATTIPKIKPETFRGESA